MHTYTSNNRHTDGKTDRYCINKQTHTHKDKSVRYIGRPTKKIPQPFKNQNSKMLVGT